MKSEVNAAQSVENQFWRVVARFDEAAACVEGSRGFTFFETFSLRATKTR